MRTNARDLLTLKEAAAMLRVSPSTVFRAIRSGQLEARRLGVHGRYRITPAAHDDYLSPTTRKDAK